MYLYLCAFCESGDHKHCEHGQIVPPGMFGGRKCTCKCNEQFGSSECVAHDNLKAAMQNQQDNLEGRFSKADLGPLVDPAREFIEVTTPR